MTSSNSSGALELMASCISTLDVKQRSLLLERAYETQREGTGQAKRKRKRVKRWSRRRLSSTEARVVCTGHAYHPAVLDTKNATVSTCLARKRSSEFVKCMLRPQFVSCLARQSSESGRDSSSVL
eukprot:2942775-Pleurochrysis_carterae.AAC.1